MKIRLTGALALAVLAISAPLASAAHGGDGDLVEGHVGGVEICHITGPDTVESLDVSPDVIIAVNIRAVDAHRARHADTNADETCEVLNLAALTDGDTRDGG